MAIQGDHTSRRIVIVGGGIAGLSVAVRLGQTGFAVTLLEASHLGQGASTRSQGWLYSGAWFAPTQQNLARLCYDSLQQTIRFCPDCLEPATAPMIYIVSSSETITSHWTNTWTAAGIPFEEIPVNVAREVLDGVSGPFVQHAFRLPDRAIRLEILLERLGSTAQHSGVEIRTETPVRELLINGDHVQGVVTAKGEEIAARLVILAANLGGFGLWPGNDRPRAIRQTEYTRVALKTHCLAVRPELLDVPFCVVDMDGFNHLPHPGVSVFGSSRWLPISFTGGQMAVPSEVDRIWALVGRLFPGFRRERHDVIEWAGTTVQAMHVDQVEPGLAPMPTVIDHEREPPRLWNLLSVFPGRASLWPQLAEATRIVVLEKLGVATMPQTARPPWADN